MASIVLPTPIVKHAPTPKPGATPGPTPVAIGVLFTARVGVLNIGSGEVDLVVSYTDTSSGESAQLTTLALMPYDQDAEPALPGQYTFTFSRPAAGAKLVCTVTVAAKDQLQFLATDGAIFVVRNNRPGTNSADMTVPTSSVCKG